MTPEDRSAKLEAQIEKLRADQEKLRSDQAELHKQLRADRAEMNKQVADAVRTGMQNAHDDLRKAIDDRCKAAVLGSGNI